MAKRFTDSRKWSDPWFRKLPSEDKMLWFYLIDTCDHAGFWKVDLELASFMMQCEFKEREVLSVFNNGKNRIVVIRKDLWHLPSFVEYQYGELRPNNNTHIAIINKLIKAGVRQGLTSPYLGVKEKDKDKEEVKVKEKVKEKDNYPEFEGSVLREWNLLCDKHPILSRVKHISGTRRKHLKSRFTDPDFKDIEGILKAAGEQPFLINGNPNSKDHSDWHISLDWLIANDTNYLKVLERKYLNGQRIPEGLEKYRKNS